MEYYLAIKRNTFESILMRWMNLEPIIQSEVKSEKYKYHILTYIWNLKRWHWWIYFQGSKGETDLENRPMDMEGGEEGEGEMYGESNIEIYHTICKTACGNLLYDSGNSNRALWQAEGWVGREMGGREHGCAYGWFLLKYDKKPPKSVK